MTNRFINYFGNKRKEVDYIIKHLPPSFNTFVDVFGGSGSVGISVKDYNGCNIVYNDVNEKPIRLIDIFKNNRLQDEVIEFNKKLIYYHDTHDEGEMFLDNLYNSLSEDMKFVMKCFFTSRSMYLIDGTTMWNIRNYRRKNNGTNTLYEIRLRKINYDEYCKTYSKIEKVYSKDYKEILEMYKNDNKAVLYLDPPYIKKRKVSYNKDGFNVDDINYMINYMKTCKCKVMLNPDHDDRYLNKGLNLKEVYDKKYGSNNKAQHCIITNY